MINNSFEIDKHWLPLLQPEFEKEYFKKLMTFIKQEEQQYRVFPPHKHIFSAFNLTPFQKLKVVIIGQDPYHGFGQANGLCFSVSDGIRKPPSLENIFKELHSDLGYAIPTSGNLESWAKQGVFLLNATLTVREKTAGSHQNKGWEQFTDEVIKTISDKKEGVIFLLWGNYAKAKTILINQTKHTILSAAHPSPLARGAFFGSKHFSQTNALLIKQGLEPINWELTNNQLFL